VDILSWRLHSATGLWRVLQRCAQDTGVLPFACQRDRVQSGEASSRYQPKEQGACAKRLATSRAYLWVVVKLAIMPLALKRGRGLPHVHMAYDAGKRHTCMHATFTLQEEMHSCCEDNLSGNGAMVCCELLTRSEGLITHLCPRGCFQEYGLLWQCNIASICLTHAVTYS